MWFRDAAFHSLAPSCVAETQACESTFHPNRTQTDTAEWRVWRTGMYPTQPHAGTAVMNTYRQAYVVVTYIFQLLFQLLSK